MKNKKLAIYFAVKKWRDEALKKPLNRLVQMGLTANMVSIFRAFLALPMFFAIGWAPWVAVLLLFSNYLLDGVDGVIARMSKVDSLKGRALDVCIDNFYVIPLVLALIFFNLVNGFWGAFYIFNASADYFINYLRFGIDVKKYPFSFSKYFVYVGMLLWAANWGNFFDVVLLFWSIVLFVINIFALRDLYAKS